MSWSLSHTQEAYAAADTNLRKLPKCKLIEAARGWLDEERERAREEGGCVPRRINWRKVPTDAIADYVSERALGEGGRCSNGGHELYVDPEGWITVPFN